MLVGHGHDTLIERLRGVAIDSHQRDRDDEIQADELAVLLTWRAGYDPRAVETMLRAISEGEPAGDDSDAHPPMPQRILRVRAFASQLPPGGAHDAARFAAHVQTLVIGDDPRIMSVAGDTILLARAGLAIDIPHGSQTELVSGEIVVATRRAGMAPSSGPTIGMTSMIAAMRARRSAAGSPSIE